MHPITKLAIIWVHGLGTFAWHQLKSQTLRYSWRNLPGFRTCERFSYLLSSLSGYTELHFWKSPITLRILQLYSETLEYHKLSSLKSQQESLFSTKLCSVQDWFGNPATPIEVIPSWPWLLRIISVCILYSLIWLLFFFFPFLMNSIPFSSHHSSIDVFHQCVH